jgi:hypothetical protein
MAPSFNSTNFRKYITNPAVLFQKKTNFGIFKIFQKKVSPPQFQNENKNTLIVSFLKHFCDILCSLNQKAHQLVIIAKNHELQITYSKIRCYFLLLYIKDMDVQSILKQNILNLKLVIK